MKVKKCCIGKLKFFFRRICFLIFIKTFFKTPNLYMPAHARLSKVRELVKQDKLTQQRIV